MQVELPLDDLTPHPAEGGTPEPPSSLITTLDRGYREGRVLIGSVPDIHLATSDTSDKMKIRGSAKISRTKVIPFLLTAIFLLLMGLALVTVGLLMEYHWDYTIGVYFKPYWTGGLVMLAGSFVALFCCLRTPAVAVVVSIVCIPGLAASILQLILTALLADVLTADDDTFFCSSVLLNPTTVYCRCIEDISFNVTVKGSVDNTSNSAFCEDEMTFLFELMLAVSCICGVLVIGLFVYVFWVLIASTRPTYAERRQSLFNGTMPRSSTLLNRGPGNGTLVLSNTMNRPRAASGALSVASTGFRPVVTVQRSQSLAQYQNYIPANKSATLRSKSGTLKSIKAPAPPEQAEPIYNNVAQDPVRASHQHRFEIPSDIQGIPASNARPSISNTPIQLPKQPKNKVLRDFEDENSSDDNTTEVIFKSSPKLLNSEMDEKIQNLESNLDLDQFGKS